MCAILKMQISDDFKRELEFNILVQTLFSAAKQDDADSANATTGTVAGTGTAVVGPAMAAAQVGFTIRSVCFTLPQSRYCTSTAMKDAR